MRADEPAATVTTASGNLGSDKTIHPWENRVLSPEECAMLQTFPPEFKWGDTLAVYGTSHMRAMIGEAVPPLFTRAQGETLCVLLRNSFRATQVSALSADDDRLLVAKERLRRARTARQSGNQGG